MDLHKKIEKATNQLDTSERTSVSEALRTIEGKVELSEAAFQRALVNSANETVLRSTVAWLAGLVHAQSLASTLESLVQEETPNELFLEVVKALGGLKRGARSLRQFLKTTTDPEKRKIGIYGLGLLRDRQAVRLLEETLANPQEIIALRAQAAESLGYIETASSVPSLLKASRDPSPEVRFWSVFALGQIADPRTRDRLAEIAENDHAKVEGWWEVSEEAKAALERIPDG